MIRKIGTVIILIIILINASCVYSETNKAFMKPEEVQEYMKYADEPENVQRAREAIFNSENKIEYTIDTSRFKEFFVDKKYSPNQKFRYADFNSDGTYTISYSNGFSFMYKKGNLLYIIKDIYFSCNKIFRYYYEPNGKLKYLVCTFDDTGAYVFDIKKTYKYKWHNYKCYDKFGNLLLKNRPFIPFK